MKTFDEWFFAKRDDTKLLDGRPIPMATTLLYDYCNQDEKKFEKLCELLEESFNAGKASQ